MTTIFKCATIAGFILGGAVAAHAAKGVATLPTNSLDNISIQLTVITPNTTTTNHGDVLDKVSTSTINTKSVISAIGSGLGVSFSPTARLLFTNTLAYTTNVYTTTSGKRTTTTTVIIGTSTASDIVVQDGAVVTPAPGYFSFTDTSVVVTNSTTETNINVTTEQTTYSIATVSFASPSLSFTVQGVDTATTIYPRATSGIYVADIIHSLSSASGTVSLTPSAGTAENGVCQGTITTSLDKLE